MNDDPEAPAHHAPLEVVAEVNRLRRDLAAWQRELDEDDASATTALAATERQLADARARVAALSAERDELRAAVAAVTEERDRAIEQRRSVERARDAVVDSRRYRIGRALARPLDVVRSRRRRS